VSFDLVVINLSWT